MRRITSPLAVAAVIMLIFAFLISCDNNITPGNSDDPGNDPVFDTAEPLKLAWMIPTQQGLSLTETPLFKNIQEKLNVTFELTELPVSQHIERKKLLIASKQIPDIMSWVTSSEANQYGPSGAFIELSQYIDSMTSFKAKVDQAVSADPLSKYTVYNNNDEIFMTPHYMVSPIPIWDFSYVKSAFDDVGAQDLTTWDKVYDALKAIKAKNPEYYPLAFRNLGGLQTPLRLFVESFTEAKATTIDYIGFDYDADMFVFAPDVEGYKEAVAYFAKYFTEGLIDPDYTVLDEQMLKTRIVKGKVVMIAEYLGGWTGYPGIMRDTNNLLFPLATPKAEGKEQIIGRRIYNFDSSVGTVLNASLADEPNKLGRCLMFLDYMYSEEFYDVQWFDGDVAEKQADGSFVYKDEVYDPEGYQVRNDTYFPWSIMANFQDSNDCRPSPGGPYQLYRDDYLKAPANADKYKPFPAVSFSVSQQTQINNYISAINDRFNSGIVDFAEGKRPITEWEDFSGELKEAGGEDLIRIYNEAYSEQP